MNLPTESPLASPPETPARKIVSIVIGTRPEAIKMAPVIRALSQHPSFITNVVSTGQHREMLRQVCERFEIPVHADLDVMRPDQGLAGLSARVLEGFDQYLASVKPDAVLVQGDTTTVLMASIASFYRKISVGHVEAGLRTGDMFSPFPEEANRRLVTPLARWHFAPTELARQNLLREGVADAAIEVTGNTVIDALFMELERQREGSEAESIDRQLRTLVGKDFDQSPLVLITGHRRENFGGGFEQICDALRQLSERFPSHLFVYPVHLNPNVKGPVTRILSGLSNIRLIEPLGYSQFVALLKACTLVLTDSGGVQEEAPGLGKPVLVMRDTTERPEGVEAGTVKLVGALAEVIVREATVLLTNPDAYRAMATARNPYGDGHAAGHILSSLLRNLFQTTAQHPDRPAPMPVLPTPQ